MKICKYPDCDRKASSNGLCHKHYMRKWRQKKKQESQSEYDKAYKKGQNEGYEMGLATGHDQAAQAVMEMLKRWNAYCYVEGDTLHLTLENEQFEEKLR